MNLLPIIIIRNLDSKIDGKNWPFLVFINANTKRGASFLARHIFESMWKDNPINLIANLFTNSNKRKMETMGHEIEVQASSILYGLEENPIRGQKSRQLMPPNYDGVFQNMTEEEISFEMRQYSSEAKTWVWDNMKLLQKYKTRLS